MKLLIFLSGLLLLEAKAEWRSIASPPVDTLARDPILALASHSGFLFASTRFGLFRSRDGGMAWTAVKAPSPFREVTGLSSISGNLYAVEDQSVYRSPDDGRTWSRITTNGSRYGFRIQGDSALIVSGIFESELSFSRDNGISWRTHQWTPGNEDITALIDLDSLLLIGTGGGVFVSRDRGATWETLDGGWSRNGVGASWLFRNGENIYLGTYISGSYVSADRGRTWREITPKLPQDDPSFEAHSVSSLEIIDGRLFAAVWHMSGNYSYPIGIYTSEDAGKTWAPRNTGLPTNPNHPSGIAVQRTETVHSLGKVLFALSPDGIYRSTDFGKTWVSANAGIDPSIRRNYGLVSLRSIGGELHVKAAVEGEGVYYRSMDGGLTWSPTARDREGILDQATGDGKTFALFPDRLLVSGNGGAGWSTVHGPWEEIPLELALLKVSGSRLFVSNGSRLYRSEDGGATWLQDSRVYETWLCQARSGSAWFKVSHGNLARSRDSGRTWTSAPKQGFFEDIRDLEASGNLLIALANDTLRLSSDQGTTWRHPEGDISGVRVRTLIRDGERFLAASNQGLFVSRDGVEWKPLGEKGLTATGLTALAASGENLVALNSMGLFHSRDLGRHWAPCDSVPPGMRVLAAWNGFFYAGTESHGVFISADTGKSWKPTNRLDPRYRSHPPNQAMAAGPSGVHVSTGSTIFRTSDQGATWIPQNIGAGIRTQAMALAEGKVWAVSTDSLFMVSGNQGATWEMRDAPRTGGIHLLSGEGPFLAAGSLEGIFLQSAPAAGWLPQGNGLPGKQLTSLLASDGRLYAGLFDQGLWVMTLPTQPTRIDASAPIASANAMILTRSPGARIFRFQLSEPAAVRVSIYSVSGKRLASLASRNPRAGVAQLEWRGHVGEAAPYLYRAEAYSLLHPGKRLHFQRGILPSPSP